MLKRLISIAPMLGLTDRHYRFLARLLTKNTLLYTEMFMANALLHGNKNLLLDYNSIEHPLALQLCGNNPKELAQCVSIAADFGYDEVNLNVGCPSKRINKAKCGIYLMKQPELVRDCIIAMRCAANVPITVKTRVGDNYEELAEFINCVSSSGITVFIIHARKALFSKNHKKELIDSKLEWEIVHRIKRDFPKLTVVINGGISKLEQISQQLKLVDGVMIGQAAYKDLYFLTKFDQFYDNNHINPTRTEILREMNEYIKFHKNLPLLHRINKHLGSLFKGQHGASKWRQSLASYRYDNINLLEIANTLK